MRANQGLLVSGSCRGCSVSMNITTLGVGLSGCQFGLPEHEAMDTATLLPLARAAGRALEVQPRCCRRRPRHRSSEDSVQAVVLTGVPRPLCCTTAAAGSGRAEFLPWSSTVGATKNVKPRKSGCRYRANEINRLPDSVGAASAAHKALIVRLKSHLQRVQLLFPG